MNKKDIKAQRAKNIGDGINKKVIEKGRKISQAKNAEAKPKERGRK